MIHTFELRLLTLWLTGMFPPPHGPPLSCHVGFAPDGMLLIDLYLTTSYPSPSNQTRQPLLPASTTALQLRVRGSS